MVEFNHFKDEIYSKWQKYLLRLSWGGLFVVAAFEIAVFLMFLQAETLERPVLEYLCLRFFIPSGTILISVTTCTILINSKSTNCQLKNFLAVLSVFVLCSIVGIFHNYFRFLFVMFGMPFILCAVFADKKMLRNLLFCSFVPFMMAVFTMYHDFKGTNYVELWTTFICAFMFVIIAYFISTGIVSYQEEQINFIYAASQKQMELIHELKIEPLTKLYNRTALDGALRSFLRKFQQGQFVPHMVLMDLDNFKKVNDTFGHAAGDEVLTKLAELIKINMKGIRRAFRFGGEEFVLLFEADTTEEISAIVNNIRRDLSQVQWTFNPGQPMTLSAGIAQLKTGQDDKAWFNTADQAMYRAKETGRDRVIIAGQS